MDALTEKKFKRTHLSSLDFEQAERFIKAAQQHPVASAEHDALLLSAIISYARPFSGNERDRNAAAASSLAPELVVLEAGDRELHDRIIALRNKAVAHAESKYNPMEFVGIRRSLRGSRGVALTTKPWQVGEENLDLNAFGRIALKMHQACVKWLSDTAVAQSANRTDQV
jgi:hypothetical protein